MWTIEEEGPCFFACFETSQRSITRGVRSSVLPRKQRTLRPHFRLITILAPRGTKASERKRRCRPSAPFIQPLPTAELACNARIRSNDFLIASISTCSIGVCVTSGRELTQISTTTAVSSRLKRLSVCSRSYTSSDVGVKLTLSFCIFIHHAFLVRPYPSPLLTFSLLYILWRRTSKLALTSRHHGQPFVLVCVSDSHWQASTAHDRDRSYKP